MPISQRFRQSSLGRMARPRPDHPPKRVIPSSCCCSESKHGVRDCRISSLVVYYHMRVMHTCPRTVGITQTGCWNDLHLIGPGGSTCLIHHTAFHPDQCPLLHYRACAVSAVRPLDPLSNIDVLHQDIYAVIQRPALQAQPRPVSHLYATTYSPNHFHTS